MFRVAARSIAAPVHERLGAVPKVGRVLGGGAGGRYVQTETFVVALTAAGVPSMPNGIALVAGEGALGMWQPHEEVIVAAGAIEGRSIAVTWDAGLPPLWDPTPRLDPPPSRDRIRAWGERVLASVGGPIGRRPGAPPVTLPRRESVAEAEPFRTLLSAVRDRDRALAREAAERLVGRGPGLTPEGDDVLAAAAGVVHALGPFVGMSREDQDRFARSLVPPDVVRRTTSLSATLLELAAIGEVIEPLCTLLETEPDGPLLERAVERLRRVGHTSGPAYLTTAGAVAVLLAG
jgi:hypothetical protein